MSLAKSYWVFDLETVDDPSLPTWERKDADRLPPPGYHQIVTAGSMILAVEKVEGKILAIRPTVAVATDGTERETLERVSKYAIAKPGTGLVTWNGRGFDLPVLAARSLLHGVPQPWLFHRNVEDRYRGWRHTDVMEALSNRGAGAKMSLDLAAKLCGWPGKYATSAKDVATLVHEGRLAEVRQYCLEDVAQTQAAFLRTLYLRGEIEYRAYAASAWALLDFCAAHAELSAVASFVDVGRWTLGCPREVASPPPAQLPLETEPAAEAATNGGVA